MLAITPPPIPQLRFSRYTSNWEQQKFKDVLTKKRNYPLSRTHLNQEAGLIRVLPLADLSSTRDTISDIREINKWYINPQSSFNMKKHSSSLCQNHDIILSDRDYTVEKVGKCIEVTGITSTTTMITGDHCLLLRPTYKFAPYYLGYYLNSPSYHNQLIPYEEGTITKQITLPLLQETRIMYPSIDEQQQIGMFFRKYDKLIDYYRRQVSLLEEQKKKLLQSIFPYTAH